MINRILIRIKVIQLLYSFMLVEQHFTLESPASDPTKEKRFAYAMYLDMLVLMVKIADSITKRGGDKPLKNRFINVLSSEEHIRALLLKYKSEPYPYAAIVDTVASAVKESAYYKNYVKDAADTSVADLNVWREIFNGLIIDNPDVLAQAQKLTNFSMRAIDRCRNMMEETFITYLKCQGNIPDAIKMLKASFEKAQELYFRLLTLPIELTDLRERQIDEAKHKYMPTREDLYPNLRFVDNQLVKLLRSDNRIQDYVAANKLSLANEDPVLLNSLLKKLTESDLYKEYMEFPATDFATDCEFWRNALRNVIFPSDLFLEALEDQSIFWNDDLEIISTFVFKTLKKFEISRTEEEQTGQVAVSPVMDMFKDEEDERFGKELFSFTANNKEEYMKLIHKHLNSHSWDIDRLAFMDVIVILAAIAEIMNFPKIPLNVSINEYIEIAKAYSTPKSSNFVHGVLGSVIAELREEGKLLK